MNARGTRIVGYLRCSTQEQADSRLGLDAQREAIQSEADRHGWTIVTFMPDEAISGKKVRKLEDRPGLFAAVTLIEAGGADALVAAKLDRLSRSTLDFCTLMERAESKGWAIIVLDAQFDMTDSRGRAFVQMLAVFAELERSMISERTVAALAQKRKQGVQLGRRRQIPAYVVKRITKERKAGVTLQAIADGLNDDAIPTALGQDRDGRNPDQMAHPDARWHPSTVSWVLSRQEA